MHVDLIDPYSKSIRQHQPDTTIIVNNIRLTFMTIINLATGWFERIEIMTYDLDEVTRGNDEYIDK